MATLTNNYDFQGWWREGLAWRKQFWRSFVDILRHIYRDLDVKLSLSICLYFYILFELWTSAAE